MSGDYLNFGTSSLFDSMNFSGTPSFGYGGTNTLGVGGSNFGANAGFDFSNTSIGDFMNTDFSGTGSLGNIGQTGGISNWFNSENLGNISAGINTLGSLFNMYQGMQALNLAEDQFNFNKNSYATELSNQANLTNERLATRQATRLRSQGITGDANDAAVAEYMEQYGVDGSI